MIKSNKQKPVICIVLAVAVILGVFVVRGISENIRIGNIEKEVFTLPSSSFSEDEFDELIEKLLVWSEENVSDSAKGVIYQRLSYICSQKGDWLGYYTYYGKAQYYLEAGEDYEDEINNLCDLLYYRYIAEGNIDLAKSVLADIDEIIAQHGLKNPQIQSIVARHHATLAIYDGNYDGAIAYAENAKSVLLDKTAAYYDVYIMGADMIAAKALCCKGDFAEAKSIINVYANSPIFEMDSYPSTLNTVDLIPYYQVACYCAAVDGNINAAELYFDAVYTRSLKYSYEKDAFDSIDFLKNMEGLSDELRASLDEIEIRLYRNYLDEKDVRYSNICNELIIHNYEDAKRTEANETFRIQEIVFFIILALFIAAVAYLFHYISMKGRIDALTRIGNRKAFDNAYEKHRTKGSPYAILMCDIDDFKLVNDTYGHMEGDEVLAGIGEILIDFADRGDIEPYRYGGEEFAVIVSGNKVKNARFIAERIRIRVSEKPVGGHSITLSIGVADSLECGDGSVLEEADKKLYTAKNSGKNRVV